MVCYSASFIDTCRNGTKHTPRVILEFVMNTIKPPVSTVLCAVHSMSRFFDKENIRNGGNRWSTVLMYLHDNLEEGGETVSGVGRVHPGITQMKPLCCANPA